MNFKDIIGAVKDMIEAHGANEEEDIYIQQSDGSYRKVSGFNRGEDGRIYIT